MIRRIVFVDGWDSFGFAEIRYAGLGFAIQIYKEFVIYANIVSEE